MCEVKTRKVDGGCHDPNLPDAREVDGPAEFGSDPAGVVIVGVALSCPP